MQEIGASDFKARCLKLIDEVGTTGSSVVISKRGRRVARLVPYTDAGDSFPQETLGGTVVFHSDVEDPAVSAEDWETLSADQR